MIKQHKHTGLGGNGMKISWNNIKNKGGKQFYTDYLLKTSGAGSGDIKFTTGFKPKRVFINAIYPTDIAQSSSQIVDNDGTLTVTTDYQVYGYRDKYSRGSGGKDAVECIYVYRDSTRRQILFMKSFDSDGFTLRYGNNGTNDVGIHILAIG